MLKNKVRELRARERVTQDDLAKAIGVSRQTIVSLEKESYVPSLVLALNIATYFKESVEDIFYQVNEEEN